MSNDRQFAADLRHRAKHTPGPADWIKENWTVGQYTPTEAFKAISNHSCVCRKDDMSLIALFGPAEDRESQKMADLFAAAPEMLEALKEAEDEIQAAGRYECVLEMVRSAIAKAQGRGE